MAGHELNKNFFEEEVWVDILYVDHNVIMQDRRSVDKEAIFSKEITRRS